MGRLDTEGLTEGESSGPASRVRFDRLARAVKDLSAARTHDEIIDISRKAARELTGAMGVAIVLRSGQNCHYIAEDSAVPLWSGQKFPLNACISGWAMINVEQVVIPDIYLDDRIPHAAYRPTGIHSLIMTPVGEGEPFAALGAYWKYVRHAKADETAVLSALASCMATALQNIDLMASLRSEAEHQQLLVNELNHRVKNTLAIVQGLAVQTLRADRTPTVARDDFESRLMSLSKAHALTTNAGWRSVSLRQLAEQTIRAFEDADDRRFALSGPEVALPPKSAVAFVLAVHELCANSAKYGALSAPAGRVDLDWSLDDERLEITWRESGGPTVRPPTQRGFGSRLLERGLAAELNGAVRMDFRPEGLVCHIDAPAPQEDPVALFPLPNARPQSAQASA